MASASSGRKGSSTASPAAARPKSRVRLTRLLQPCSGTCDRLITGVPSRSSIVALRVAYWKMSGTIRSSTHSLRGDVGDLHHAPVGVERQRQDHLVDAVLGDHPRDLVEVADHRDVEVAAVALRRVVVEEADHLEAELAVVEDLAGDVAAQLAGADHQDPHQVVALEPRRPQPLADDAAGGDHQHEIERPEEAEEATAVGKDPGDAVGADVGRAHQDDARGEQHRRQDDRHHQGQRLVHPVAAARRLVEAVEVEHQRPEQQDQRQQGQIAREIGRLGEGKEPTLEAQEPGGEEGAGGGDEIARQIERGGGAAALADHLQVPLGPTRWPGWRRCRTELQPVPLPDSIS